MPILGTVASQFSSKPFSSYESIATLTADGTNSFFTFSSIPQTYRHLQIRGYSQSQSAGTATDYVRVHVNGNMSSIYTNHWVYVSGTTLTIQQDNTNTKMYGNRARGGQQFSVNDVAVMIIDIHDYAVTTKNKTFYMHSGWAPNVAGDSYCQIGTGMPLLTSAITSITLGNDNTNFRSNSQWALYGIKGS